MNTVDVGKFIFELRKERKLTQKELAQELNVTDKAISKWETGKCYPDIEMLEKLSVLFDVSINEILSGKKSKPENQIIEAEKNIVDVMKNSKRIKNKWQIIAFILSLVSVISCFFSINKASSEHQVLTATQADFNTDTMFRIDISEVGLKNVFIRQMSDCGRLGEDIYSKVYLLCDDRYNDDRFYSDNYLAVIINDKIIVKDIAKWEEQGSYSGEIVLCDVDGDNDEEIVLQETIGMSGGAGQYLSRVFDYKDDEIIEIFSSGGKESDRYDTGFSSTVLKGEKIKIYNSITEYKEIFTLENRSEAYYTNNWYDEDGEPRKLDLLVDSFYKFEPEDADGDGVYEIKCYQYTSLCGHTDYVGTAVTTLKYNTKLRQFEVWDAYFEIEKNE